MNVWFVTGTDTDAGKTLVTSGLLYTARQQQLSTLGLKPIASGNKRRLKACKIVMLSPFSIKACRRSTTPR